jgi:hypothetical protein
MTELLDEFVNSWIAAALAAESPDVAFGDWGA